MSSSSIVTPRSMLNNKSSLLQHMVSSPMYYYDSTDAIRADINPPSMNNSQSFRNATRQRQIMYWIQIGFTIILIVLIILFFIYHDAVYEWMESYIELIRNEGILFAPILYIATCYLSICLLIPQTLISLFGGFIFVKLLGLKGIISAVFIVWFGCSLGSIQSFINCRYCYQKINCFKRILKDEYNDYAQVYQSIKQNQNGFKLIFYMRILPWTPYSVFNIAMATTNVTLIHFAFGSILGMILDIILYCFIGAFIDSISRLMYNDNSHDWASAIMIVTFIGTILSIFIMIYIGKISFIKYKAILQKTSQQKRRIFPIHHQQDQDSISSSGTIKEVSLASNVSDFV